MIPTFFDSPYRLALLEREARSWQGTPFFANSEARGRDGGVDCVRLLHAIYRAAGVIPAIEIPPQVMDHGQHSRRGLLEEAFETWPYLCTRFVRLPDCSPASRAAEPRQADRVSCSPCSPANTKFLLEQILPGDALCFVAGFIPHHAGLALGGGMVAHVLKPEGVHFLQLAAVIRGRRILGELAAVYRPRP